MKNKKIKVMIIIILILLVIDQVSKVLINKNLTQEVVLIENVLSITSVQNEGMAFGINENNLENIILSIFVLYVLIRFVKRQEKNMSKIVIVCISMIIAGGIGNLIDRIFRGAVFDFIKFLSLPVFNFADMFICIGWFVYVLYLLLFAFKTI